MCQMSVTTYYELQCGQSFKGAVITGHIYPQRAADWYRKSSPLYGMVATVRHLSRTAAQGQEVFLSDRRVLSSGRVRERGSGWAEDKGSCYAPVSSSDQPIRRGNSAESAAGYCSRPNAGGGGVGGGRGASRCLQWTAAALARLTPWQGPLLRRGGRTTSLISPNGLLFYTTSATPITIP